MYSFKWQKTTSNYLWYLHIPVATHYTKSLNTQNRWLLLYWCSMCQATVVVIPWLLHFSLTPHSNYITPWIPVFSAVNEIDKGPEDCECYHSAAITPDGVWKRNYWHRHLVAGQQTKLILVVFNMAFACMYYIYWYNWYKGILYRIFVNATKKWCRNMTICEFPRNKNVF